jgi:hypothetical protein
VALLPRLWASLWECVSLDRRKPGAGPWFRR